MRMRWSRGSSDAFPARNAVRTITTRSTARRSDNTCDVCGSHEFKRRPDDNEDTVRTRMAEYRAKTAPIIPIYDARGILTRIDGMGDMDASAQRSRGIGREVTRRQAGLVRRRRATRTAVVVETHTTCARLTGHRLEPR